MEKKFSASRLALIILFIISAVVLVMFYCVGYGNQDTMNGAVYTCPQNTGLLLIWLYALVVICAAVVFIFAIVNGIKGAKSKKGKKTSFVGIIFLIMLIVVVASYFLASTEPVRLGSLQLCEKVSDLKISDTCLYSIYVLLVAAIVSAVLAMLGVFKAKVAKK